MSIAGALALTGLVCGVVSIVFALIAFNVYDDDLEAITKVIAMVTAALTVALIIAGIWVEALS